MSRPESQLGVGHLDISTKEREYVNRVLDANRLSYGPFSKRLETEFAAIHGSKFGVLSNSGTSALQVALAAMKEKYGWEDGDEVLVPAVTFVATANIVMMLNLTPVFVDVCRDTYNIDPTRLSRHLTTRTRAIIPVHLFGLPADMQPIMEFAVANELRVLEDSCEAMFVEAYGKPVGSFGDVGCFSTYVAHFLVTGVGGLSITSDPDLAVMMRSLCNHGRDSIYLSIDDDQGRSPEGLAEVVERRFNFVRLGYSYRITEMEAALGVAQLEDRQRIITGRQTSAKVLLGGLTPLEEAGHLQLPRSTPYAEHGFMIFPIVLDDRHDRNAFALHLEEAMIETRPMMPLINQPFYRRLFGDLDEAYPEARRINEQGLYIGCHHGFSSSDLDYINASISSFFVGST